MADQEALLLDALYLGVRDRTDFDNALRGFAAYFDCPSAALVDFDAAAPDTSIFCSVGIFGKEVRDKYLTQYASIDPAPAEFARLRPGKASTALRLIGADQAKSCEFLQDFYRPSGLEDCLGGTLVTDDARFALIGLHRGPEREDFSDRDIQALERLMPHVARALQLRRSFLAMEQRAGILSESMDRLAAGVVALDDRGRSVAVNRAMRVFAERTDGLSLDRRGHLVATEVTAGRMLRKFQGDVLTGGPGGVVRVPRRSTQSPYVVLVAPLALGDGPERRGSTRPPGVIFVVHDPELRQSPLASRIQHIFGLRSPAAQLVAAIFEGEDLRNYAERNDISVTTARFHLKTAFTRTGVRSQTALVKLVAHALRDLGPFHVEDDK